MTPRTLGPGRSHVAVARSDSGPYLATISTPTQVGGGRRVRAVLSAHEPDRKCRSGVLVGAAGRGHADRGHRPGARRAGLAGCADLDALVRDPSAVPPCPPALRAQVVPVRR